MVGQDVPNVATDFQTKSGLDIQAVKRALQRGDNNRLLSCLRGSFSGMRKE
jgi:hypothetical protein